jgi:hypothetical protein
MIGHQKAGTLMTGSSNSMASSSVAPTLGELLRAHERFRRVQLNRDVLL